VPEARQFYTNLGVEFTDCKLDLFTSESNHLPYLSFSNSLLQHLELNDELKDFTPNGWYLHLLHSTNGQLTNPGKVALQGLGEYLRSKYVPGLLSESFNKSEVNLRSSNIVRTIESLQYLVNGLYPEGYRSSDPIHIDCEPRIHEVMVPSQKCRSYDREINALRHELETSIHGKISALNTRLAAINPIDTFTMYDVFASMSGNSIPLPAPVTRADVAEMEDIVVQTW
jgi:Histidine phosphatase superfamily (branch 2)